MDQFLLQLKLILYLLSNMKFQNINYLLNNKLNKIKKNKNTTKEKIKNDYQ